MPYRLKVTLTLARPFDATHGYPGVAVHGLVYRAVAATDAELVTALHVQRAKPFSVVLEPSSGEPEQFVFYLHVLDEALVEPFLDAFRVGTDVGQSGEALRGFVSGLELSGKTYRRLIEEVRQNKPPRLLECYFLSCTALSHKKRMLLHPVPRVIWNGLALRWQALSPYPLGGDYSRWFDTHIDCLEDTTQTCRQKIGKSSLKGFRGRAMFGLADDEDAWVAVLLAQFAEFSGVGVKTGYGCGSMWLSIAP